MHRPTQTDAHDLITQVHNVIYSSCCKRKDSFFLTCAQSLQVDIPIAAAGVPAGTHQAYITITDKDDLSAVRKHNVYVYGKSSVMHVNVFSHENALYSVRTHNRWLARRCDEANRSWQHWRLLCLPHTHTHGHTHNTHTHNPHPPHPPHTQTEGGRRRRGTRQTAPGTVGFSFDFSGGGAAVRSLGAFGTPRYTKVSIRCRCYIGQRWYIFRLCAVVDSDHPHLVVSPLASLNLT